MEFREQRIVGFCRHPHSVRLVVAAALMLVGMSLGRISAQDRPSCDIELPGDFIVGKNGREVVTLTGTRSFGGRIVVKNGSRLNLLNADAEIAGDVLLCSSSTLRIEGSVVNLKARYIHERNFRADNRSSFEFINSFFINEQQFVPSMELAGESRVTMNFVNRIDLAREELTPKLVGWSIGMDKSNMVIEDTVFIGEVTGFSVGSGLRFARSLGLILWINFLQPGSGGTLTPPQTGETLINWRLDRNSALVHGIDYSIEIENSSFITPGVLIYIHPGVPNADILLRNGALVIGLVFIGQDRVQIENFREGLHEDFSPAIPGRRVRLENIQVMTWNIYSFGSNILVADSEIGEAFSDSFPDRTGRVEILRSKLTGNGGYYGVFNTFNVATVPSLIMTDCDIQSDVVAKTRALAVLRSCRVLGAGPVVQPQLVADGGDIMMSDSYVPAAVPRIIAGNGTLWSASLDVAVEEPGGTARRAIFRGNASISGESPNFSESTIDVAPLTNRSQSVRIHRSTAPVVNGVLFNWDFQAASSPRSYIATLTLRDRSGRVFEATRIFSDRTPMKYSVPPNGTQQIKTSGTGAELKVGSAVLTPATGEAAPVGALIFSFVQQGVFVGEAAVQDSRLTTKGSVFVDLNERNRPGVAISNPNLEETRVNIALRAVDGSAIAGRASLIVPPNGQVARFVDQFFENAPPNFLGSLQIESDRPVALAAIKGRINELGDFLMTTLPVSLPRAINLKPLIFPHLANGGGYRTRIILENPSAEVMAGTTKLRTSAGGDLRLTIGDRTASEFSYSIPPNGVYSIATGGEGELVVGYATVNPTRGRTPSGSVLFSYTQDGVTVAETGVGDAPLSRKARVFFEFTRGRRDTGIAIANPNDRPARISVVVRSGAGALTTGFEIPARGHTARYITQIATQTLDRFTGTLDLESDVEVAVIAIRSTFNERGHALLSTLPVANLMQSAEGRHLFFPQFADGMGFQTEAILINPGTTAITGTMSFYGPEGNPQTTGEASQSPSARTDGGPGSHDSRDASRSRPPGHPLPP